MYCYNKLSAVLGCTKFWSQKPRIIEAWLYLYWGHLSFYVYKYNTHSRTSIIRSFWGKIIIWSTVVPSQVDKNARWISLSKSLRGTLFKPRRRQLVLVLLYSKTKTYIIHGFWEQNLVRPGTVDNRGRTIFNNFTLQWRIFWNTVNFPVHFQHFRSWSVYLFRTSFWYVKKTRI